MFAGSHTYPIRNSEIERCTTFQITDIVEETEGSCTYAQATVCAARSTYAAEYANAEGELTYLWSVVTVTGSTAWIDSGDDTNASVVVHSSGDVTSVFEVTCQLTDAGSATVSTSTKEFTHSRQAEL